jgi:hypothetical protein
MAIDSRIEQRKRERRCHIGKSSSASDASSSQFRCKTVTKATEFIYGVSRKPVPQFLFPVSKEEI